MKTIDNKIIKKSGTYYAVKYYDPIVVSIPPLFQKVKCTSIVYSSFKTNRDQYVNFTKYVTFWRNFDQKSGVLVFENKEKALKKYKQALVQYIDFLENKEDEIMGRLEVAKKELCELRPWLWT